MSKSKKCVKCFNGNLIASIFVGAAAGGFGYGIVSVLSSLPQSGGNGLGNNSLLLAQNQVRVRDGGFGPPPPLTFDVAAIDNPSDFVGGGRTAVADQQEYCRTNAFYGDAGRNACISDVNRDGLNNDQIIYKPFYL